MQDFERIHQDFRPVVLRYLQRLSRELPAEDLTQEVFLKISRGLKGFRGESPLSTWIYRIATTTALDWLRSRNIREEAGTDRLLGEQGPEVEDRNIWTGHKALPPDQKLIRKEMNDCIRELIEKLPADYRTVIILSELEELKNRDIANILGISLEAAKIRLHRARAQLKKELEKHCSFYRDERNELACDRKPTPLSFRSSQ